MGLILDHINGVRDDNRLGNLRIVCPNCAATLDTHCGRKNRLERPERTCLRCAAASALAIHSSATAHVRAVCDTSARASRTPGCVASSGRPTTSSYATSRRRATSRSAAATACRTTRSANGCASTSARRRPRRSAQRTHERQRQALRRDRARRAAGRDDEPVAAGGEAAQALRRELDDVRADARRVATTSTSRLRAAHDLDAQRRRARLSAKRTTRRAARERVAALDARAVVCSPTIVVSRFDGATVIAELVGRHDTSVPASRWRACSVWRPSCRIGRRKANGQPVHGAAVDAALDTAWRRS